MSRLLVFLFAAVLAGCATTPTRLAPGPSEWVDHEARLGALRAQASWSFRGRIAVSHDGEAGNAGIEWRQAGDAFEIRLTAPVTGRSWLLRQDGGQARLSGLDGGDRVGPEAEALLLQATGWHVPVAALAHWLRGGAAGPDARLEFTPGGLPARLQERGWSVDYRAWSVEAPQLPMRVFADNGTSRVRLVVTRWGEP